MSHGLKMVNGRYEAMFANSPAWHNLGNVAVGAPTGADAIRIAHLDWNVEKRPIYTQVPGDVLPVPVTDYRATVRTDTNDVLGIVGSEYGIVQNVEAFNLLDGLVPDGLVRYESAFALDGGKSVIVLARLPQGDREVLPGDVCENFVMLATAHDGTRALQLLPTSVRVVCQNTYRLALSRDAGKGLIKVRHTSGVLDNARQAIAVIAHLNKAFDGHIELARAMVRKSLDRQSFNGFLNEVAPLPEQTAGKAAHTRAQTLHATLTRSYEQDPTNNLPGMERTVWAAFNAVTGYVDHTAKYGRAHGDASAEFKVKLLGSGQAMKARAWDAATKLAGVAG